MSQHSRPVPQYPGRSGSRQHACSTSWLCFPFCSSWGWNVYGDTASSLVRSALRSALCTPAAHAAPYAGTATRPTHAWHLFCPRTVWYELSMPKTHPHPCGQNRHTGPRPLRHGFGIIMRTVSEGQEGPETKSRPGGLDVTPLQVHTTYLAPLTCTEYRSRT
jgi:hypothetical protein